MKAVDWRLVRSIVCLCLPTAAVVLLGIVFLVDRVPEIIRNERRRVQNEYREQALEIRNRTDAASVVVVRGKSGGWAKDRKMAPGYWGFVPGGTTVELVAPEPSFRTVGDGMTLVWYVDEHDVCRAKEVKTVEEVDFCFIFWVCGSFLLLFLTGLTWMGVRYFVNYVQSRDDFLAATAHDLTTPLVGMRYMIGRSDREARNLNERMLRLVDNIKDFLKLGGRRKLPQRERVNLLKCYDEAYSLFCDDYRDLFDGEDVQLAVSPDVESDPMVWADETMTVQILWNLLGNDLKYAAPYGKVRVEVSAADGFVQIAFVDEGKGMTAREMRRAFDRYYRAKTVLESGKGGFGIGLCTAREFAGMMGGELTVRANLPHGCIFTLKLPQR